MNVTEVPVRPIAVRGPINGRPAFVFGWRQYPNATYALFAINLEARADGVEWTEIGKASTRWMMNRLVRRHCGEKAAEEWKS